MSPKYTEADRYAVFGNPISHSLSPKIHRMFAEQTHQNMCYVSLCFPLDQFERDARFFLQEGKGANVTLPFKTQALHLATELTERARLAGAVNTLIRQDHQSILGDNTDGVGLLQDLTRLKIDVRHKRLLILGAGGAVRGVLAPLLAQNPTSIDVWNRTLSVASSLVGDFKSLGNLYFREKPQGHYDLIINGTSSGLTGDIPSVLSASLLLEKHTKGYDMLYGATPTPFCLWAQSHGVTAHDGLGMLVHQAAESFSLWRKIKPSVEPVIDALRTSLRA